MSISVNPESQGAPGNIPQSDPGLVSRPTPGDFEHNLQKIFRNFTSKNFCETDSWLQLQDILKGNGGCYGIYGPRGSGKTWLMLMAIEQAQKQRGLGLWFPCPSNYNPMDFLSALSDNLASTVQRRFAKGTAIVSALGRMQNFLAAIAAIITFVGLVLYGSRGLTVQNRLLATTSSVFPIWLWILVAVSFGIAILTAIIRFYYNNFSTGNLVREAGALRERIRFTQSLKLGLDVRVSGGKGIIGLLARSQEKTLNERPASVASLIFDFRNLAEHIVRTLGGEHFVVSIDELDKISNPKAVRSLLRNIKGIFEVDGMSLLVSISEEAAASLHIGVLKSGGRNELNSSFFAVVGLPPLEPAEAETLLRRRDLEYEGKLASALCLLAGGNRRELIRMAHSCAAYSRQHDVPLDERTIVALLEAESLALLNEIARHLPADPSASRDDHIKYRSWAELPREVFRTQQAFIRFGQSAIRDSWAPRWGNDVWNQVSESWRRLLIRIFVSAKVLASRNATSKERLLDDESAVAALRDILVLATLDSAVARLMLQARFGDNFSDPYR